MPVLARYRMASMKSRLSFPTPPCCPGRPGSRSLIRSQSASNRSWRLNIIDPKAERSPPRYRKPPNFSQYALADEDSGRELGEPVRGEPLRRRHREHPRHATAGSDDSVGRRCGGLVPDRVPRVVTLLGLLVGAVDRGPGRGVGE